MKALVYFLLGFFLVFGLIGQAYAVECYPDSPSATGVNNVSYGGYNWERIVYSTLSSSNSIFQEPGFSPSSTYCPDDQTGHNVDSDRYMWWISYITSSTKRKIV